MSDVYEDRQREQRIREQARQAARKLYPDANVSQSAHVHVVEDSGAFVELHVWIPKETLVKG